MTPEPRSPLRLTWAAAVCAGSLVVGAPAWAAPPPPAGERLSAWLLRTYGPQADTTALHWRNSSEQLPQLQLRQAVLAAIESSPSMALSRAQRQPLADWVARLPLTGRLTLATHDPRALEVMPEADPIRGSADEFVRFPRPTRVLVVDEAGLPCLVEHVAGALVRDYLHACASERAPPARVDRAWIAQPDGRVQSVGLAAWNQTLQHQPGPGAWIWAPSRSARVPHELSDNLARLLATQPPPEAHPLLAGAAVQPGPVLDAGRHEPTGATLTGNDWGELGFMQTPSARMAGAGTVRSTISHVHPYTRLSVKLQPLDWFEFGFRYTDIALAGDQSYRDKSFDLKIRLRAEDARWPEVAVGLRDLGGTGLFASEYLVASKRWGNWDASLGLGWGNLGSRGNVANPLRLLGSRFERRAVADVGFGGRPNLDKIFTGPAALFGGLQWASPAGAWVFKAELDGNSYQAEPLDNPQPVDSPFNFGLVYRHSPGLALNLSWQRGNRLAFGLTLQTGLDQLHSPKLLDPAPPPLRAQTPASLPAAGWAGVAGEINRHTGWEVQSVRQVHTEAVIVAEVDQALYLEQRVERVARLLHALAPAEVRGFRLQLTRRALPLSELHIDRAEWLLQRAQAVPPSQALVATRQHGLALAPAAVEPPHWQARRATWGAHWSPTFSKVIGGPDGFLLYELGVAASAEWRPTPRTWLTGVANLRLLDNYERFDFTGLSDLPRVRTYLREYVVSSRLTLPRLDLTHARHLGGNHYASVYAGLLEPMFGGVGAEWLYRPFGRSWAFGVDVNHVWQRGFRQNFSFRDYHVTTGHATLHWDTGWNDVHAKVQVGRYLAGDEGLTLDLSRTFRNGTAIGAWATFTNVPFEVFGEGSFDKGIYVRIPFDAMLPLSSPAVADLRWTPLTRDGGARLNRPTSLFDLTQARGARALHWRAATPAPPRSAERTTGVLHEPPALPFDDPFGGLARLLGQVGDIPAATWWWAGGALLGSALLDDSADRWAARHQGGRWERLGNAASAAPLLMAAGSALLASGVAGQPAASTAQTSLLAGAGALGASLAVRALAGRSRPLQGQGSGHFSGPGPGSIRSAFPSNHSALAFALATPFARQHQMPWLYGVAAATALGRVQQREHWLSDTVAGALLGFGIGSLLSMQHEAGGGGPHIRFTGQSIQADWRF